MKIVGMGFVLHDEAYLRDGWNCLDFLLVVAAYLKFLPGVANFTGLRVLRVLRALRSINKVRGMKILISSLLVAMKGFSSRIL